MNSTTAGDSIESADAPLAHISLGEVQSALAEYEETESDAETLASARRFVEDMERYWDERGLKVDDARTVQYSI